MTTMPPYPPDLLPYGTNVFIAGGYAACPELAGDMDVWVVDTTGRLEQTRKRLLEHLHHVGATYAVDSSVLDIDCQDIYEGMGYRVLRVARITRLNDKRLHQSVHLLVVDAPVNVVLDGFDVSTHQCALALTLNDATKTHTWERVHGSQWTPLNVVPRQLRPTSSTTDRMKKITDRYAHLREKDAVDAQACPF